MPILHDDSLTRHLCAVDASVYQPVPAAAGLPEAADDLMP